MLEVEKEDTEELRQKYKVRTFSLFVILIVLFSILVSGRKQKKNTLVDVIWFFIYSLNTV